MAAPAHIQTGLGADIRGLRKSRGLTLHTVAEQIDRSTGWLSHVERGQIDPGINDLKRLAGLFGISVSFFFRNDTAPEGEHGLIVRQTARVTLGSAEAGLVEELLSPHLSGPFEMIRSTFLPGAESGIVPARATQEGGYIVSGRLQLWLDGTRHDLVAGDSFQFDQKPYRWRNPSAEVCVVVWIISPPIY